jgi:hypothetical protein
MKKNRRRLFSDKDGTKFSEDFEALSEQIKAFIHTPAFRNQKAYANS